MSKESSRTNANDAEMADTGRPTRRRTGRFSKPQRGKGNGTLATVRRRRMVCARNGAPAPIRQEERRECQRVSSKNSAPSRSAAGKSATLDSPAHLPRSRSSPEGPRLEAWFAPANRAGRRQAAPTQSRLITVHRDMRHLRLLFIVMLAYGKYRLDVELS
jgi:hypothetical protein